MKKLLVVVSFLSYSAFVNAQSLVGTITGEYSSDRSGHSVSMPDANTVAIGGLDNDGNGSNSGHVRVYSLSGSSWTQKGLDIDGEATEDYSGYSVSMPDANTVAIGAFYNDGNGSRSGHVRIYSWNGSNWTQKGLDIDGESSNDQSGYSVSMPDANTVAIGAPINDGNGSESGHVRIYIWNGSSWTQKGLDIDGEATEDYSGYSVSMPDANTVAIGAPYNDGNGISSGHVRIYSWNGSNWTQKGLDIDGEYFRDQSGSSVSMPDANTVAIGAPDNDGNGSESGHVRIYSWNGNSWTQKGLDIDGEATEDYSGYSVSMPNANTVAIGAPYNDGNGISSGHVRIYSWNGDGWIKIIEDLDGQSYGNQSGISISMPNANTIANGAYGADSYKGKVSIYSLIPEYNSLGCLECSGISPGTTMNGDNNILVVDRPMLDSLISIGYDLSNVCVSNITNLDRAFYGKSSFNQDISSWDVSNVTEMDSMFYGCLNFDRDIGNWDVSSVQSMNLMFYGATAFNSPLSDWDVSNVNSMKSMFLFASSFNQPIWNWKVNNVSNMTNMFYYASSFDQDLSSWCVSTIGSEPAGFAASSALTSNNKPSWGTCREAQINTDGCLECDQFAVGEWLSHEGDSVLVVNRIMLDSLISNTTYDLEYVCLSKVDNLDSLFVGKTIHGDISVWDVSNVTSMAWTFANQSTFNQEIGNWDISNVESLSHVFINAPTFNHDIGNWNTESVINMDAAFFFANSFNQDISGWDVSNVTSMNSMFLQAGAFDQDLKPWCMSNVPIAPYDFALNSGLQANNYPRWGVCEAVPGVYINNLGCIECDSLNVGDFFVLNGDSIEVVDRTRLLALVAAQGDLTKVCVSHVQNMKNIFRGAKWFNQDITKWDMSNVTNTVNMFFNAETFNQNLSTWDVSSVTNMTRMFFRADSFNQNLNVWDVSQVTGMSRMFGEAASFNGKIDQWDVSGVNRMTEMFKEATSFNQDLSSWCVSNFEYNAPTNFALNSPLLPAHYPIWGNCPTPYGDNVLALATGAFIDSSGCVDCSALNVGDYFTLGGDTMLVVDRTMLDSLVILRRDLSKVCVSHITDMKDALRGLRWFNTDISGWDVSNVTDMTNMFFKSKIFNQEIGNWNVSNVTNMNRMFQKAESFNGDLSNWDVSNVNKMNATFFGASAFNQDIGDWDVGNITVAEAMFRNAGAFSQDLSMWCVTKIAAQPNLFDWNAGLTSGQLPVWGTCPTPPPYEVLPNGCISCAALNIGDQFTLNGVNYTVVDRPMLDSMITGNHDISKACVSHVTEIDFLFYSVSSSNYNPNISKWDVSNVTNMAGIFYNKDYFNSGIGAWDVSSVTNMNYMFYGADRFNQDIGQWDVSSVQTMKKTFYNYHNTSSQLNIGSWDVSSVTDMSDMFRSAYYFNEDIGNWDVSSVTEMSNMFNSARAFNKDIGNWDVSSVTDMSYMFTSASDFNQDIGNWDVSSVTDMSNMFNGARALNKDIGNWDVSSVTNMSNMFDGAQAFNKDIGNWDVSSVNFMSNMFNTAYNFNKDIGNWDVSSVIVMTSMFYNANNFNQDISSWCVSHFNSSPYNFLSQSTPLISFYQPQWGAPCASPSIAAPDQTDWTTNSTIEGQGNALNLADGNGISIYPNPTTEIINLDPVPFGKYRLYNEIGRLIDQGRIQPRFDLSNFDNGNYMLLLQTDNESKYFKVIKQ